MEGMLVENLKKFDEVRNNNNFKYLGQIASYEMNNIFTDCKNNQIE